MNVGNLDIDVSTESVTLRMRHVVQGHPGCVLSRDEVRTLITRLEQALSKPPAAVVDEDEEFIG